MPQYAHKYDKCIGIFEEILSIDPYRIELLDVYSNMPYVKEKRKILLYLARWFMVLNKYRPETCCIGTILGISIMNTLFVMNLFNNKMILFIGKLLLESCIKCKYSLELRTESIELSSKYFDCIMN